MTGIVVVECDWYKTTRSALERFRTNKHSFLRITTIDNIKIFLDGFRAGYFPKLDRYRPFNTNSIFLSRLGPSFISKQRPIVDTILVWEG